MKAKQYRRRGQVEALEFDGTEACANAIIEAFGIEGARFVEAMMVLPAAASERVVPAGHYVLKSGGIVTSCYPKHFLDAYEEIPEAQVPK